MASKKKKVEEVEKDLFGDLKNSIMKNVKGVHVSVLSESPIASDLEGAPWTSIIAKPFSTEISFISKVISWSLNIFSSAFFPCKGMFIVISNIFYYISIFIFW